MRSASPLVENAGAPSALIAIPGAEHCPYNKLEKHSDDLFGFVSTYARRSELKSPSR